MLALGLPCLHACMHACMPAHCPCLGLAHCSLTSVEARLLRTCNVAGHSKSSAATSRHLMLSTAKHRGVSAENVFGSYAGWIDDRIWIEIPSPPHHG